VKTLDRLSVLLNRIPNESTDSNTPELIAKSEIESFLSKEVQIDPHDICTWWGSKQQYESMPCLSQVSLALLANKMSSGGLECDIGSMNDVIAPKRSTLRAGLIEVNMFLKLNKNLYYSLDPSEVVKLDSKWESSIPHRPVLDLYDDDDGHIVEAEAESTSAEDDDDELEAPVL
jgi:hypothetical protein